MKSTVRIDIFVSFSFIYSMNMHRLSTVNDAWMIASSTFSSSSLLLLLKMLTYTDLFDKAREKKNDERYLCEESERERDKKNKKTVLNECIRVGCIFHRVYASVCVNSKHWLMVYLCLHVHDE